MGHLTQVQTIKCSISPHPTKSHQMCITHNEGKSSKTIITPIGHGVYTQRRVTKVLLQPITGRRHQLRLHCTSIGHPIVGDMTYAQDSQPPRMMLHAYQLQLPLSPPFEPINVQTDDPFPTNLFDEFIEVKEKRA